MIATIVLLPTGHIIYHSNQYIRSIDHLTALQIPPAFLDAIVYYWTLLNEIIEYPLSIIIHLSSIPKRE